MILHHLCLEILAFLVNFQEGIIIGGKDEEEVFNFIDAIECLLDWKWIRNIKAHWEKNMSICNYEKENNEIIAFILKEVNDHQSQLYYSWIVLTFYTFAIIRACNVFIFFNFLSDPPWSKLNLISLDKLIWFYLKEQ